MRKFSVTTFLLPFLLISKITLGQVSIEGLVVEYQKTPLGLDVEQPRFSWKMVVDNGERGYSQSAYQIVVENEDGERVWDTNKTDLDNSLNVVYDGEKLEPTSQYRWNVTVWDQDGKEWQNSSWFETGLMNSNPNLEAWDNAQWIGGSSQDLVLYAHALTVFKVGYTVQLDSTSNSTKAGFIFGANDRRLMNKNLNILGAENGFNESYFEFEIDISDLGEGKDGSAKLNIYRVGYAKTDDPNTPLRSLQIPEKIINASNKYHPHQVNFDMDFGKCVIYIGERKQENSINDPEDLNQPFGVPGLSINPHGDMGGDQIAYPVLGDIGFKMGEGQKALFSDIQVMNHRAPSNLLFSEAIEDEYEGIFLSALNDKDVAIHKNAFTVGSSEVDVLVTADPSQNSMPMMRTEFATSGKKISKARLYVTARGIYEIYLNGKRLGDDYFNPGLTQYNKTHMYQTYDVTDYLTRGQNAIGAMFGEGWWSGNITYRGQNWNYFGDRQSLLAKMVITYEDGTSQTIITDPDNWKYFNDGPTLYGSFFQGEIYDARKESAIEGWSSAGYDDNRWKKTVEVPLKGTAFIDDGLNYDNLKIIGQIGTNAKIVKQIQAQSVEEVRPGVFVYDMGQNMVGFPQITLSGSEGDTITMRYAEMRYPDLPEHEEYDGMIMMENIRAALTTDRWILNGGEEVIQPRFTFHGYRFLEITGIAKAIPISDVKGMVVSSIVELSSSYETSNDLVNRLWKNITWSFRGNFLSIPTDTPARNERMGWNGDINVFAKTATYLGDIPQFLRRHLIANRDLQREDGRFPDIAPIGTGFGGTLWGSAGVTIPWQVYQQFGDRRLLEEHYDAMKDYVDFLASKQDPETGILDEGPLGDWLSPEGLKNDNSMLWTAYQVYDLEIVYKTAQILGKTEDVADYKKQYENRRAFFNETYVDPSTHKTIHTGHAGFSFGPPPENPPRNGDLVNTQASYAIPLDLGVFNEENEKFAGQYLADAVQRSNKDDQGVMRPEISLMTGFIGTASLMPALSESGHDDLAYKLLQQTSYPSWLYSVRNGATTIWERLNSYTIEEGFGGNNSMNSFNHYSFGAVGSWMYNYSLGIQRGKPGFKSFVLQPTPDPNGQMTWAKGHYESMYGTIKSEWKVEDGQLTYRTTVPANTSATLHLPTSNHKRVKESRRKASKSSGVTFVNFENGKAVYKLTSGEYEFESEL